MRISDWSSDVCSSDLVVVSLGDPVDTTTPQGRFTLQILAAVGELERALIRERTVAGLEHARKEGRMGGNPGLAAGDPANIRKLARAREDQIGRESCRERVCKNEEN